VNVLSHFVKFHYKKGQSLLSGTLDSEWSKCWAVPGHLILPKVSRPWCKAAELAGPGKQQHGHRDLDLWCCALGRGCPFFSVRSEDTNEPRSCCFAFSGHCCAL